MVAKATGRVVGVAFVLACAVPARAQGSESFRFSWVRGEGAGACPDTRALAARVSERLGRNPFSDAAEQSIEGSVSARDGRFHAELRVRDAGGIARGSRELAANGPDCAELADAVVLAVALTIDPNAALGGPPTPAPPAAPPDVPPVAEPPALERCPEVRCPPSEPCRPVPCPPRAVPPRAAIVARAVVAAGVLPGMAPGAGVFGEVGGERLRGALGMRYFPETTTDGGRYGFGLTVGTAGVVLTAKVSEALELAGIAELELGASHAVVYELEPVEPGDQPWVAAAVGPRLGFSGLRALRIELGVSLVVPFVRPTFEVRGAAEPVFQSAPVAVLGYFGLGLGTP
jgi:hypothetical protein